MGTVFFTSVAVSLTSDMTKWNDCLLRLGYRENEGLNCLSSILRRTFVEELLKKQNYYQPFLQCELDYNVEAAKFPESGFFDGALGYCIPIAMATVL